MTEATATPTSVGPTSTAAETAAEKVARLRKELALAENEKWASDMKAKLDADADSRGGPLVALVGLGLLLLLCGKKA